MNIRVLIHMIAAMKENLFQVFMFISYVDILVTYKSMSYMGHFSVVSLFDYGCVNYDIKALSNVPQL